MQKNYSLLCTGVYRPLGGVPANMAFNAGSKTQACGEDPQSDGPSSPSLPPTLPPQGDTVHAKPFRVCKLFPLVCLYGQSPTHPGEGLGAPGQETNRPVLRWRSWGGAPSGPRVAALGRLWPSRGGSKRCPTSPMDPGRLPEGGGVWRTI